MIQDDRLIFIVPRRSLPVMNLVVLNQPQRPVSNFKSRGTRSMPSNFTDSTVNYHTTTACKCKWMVDKDWCKSEKNKDLVNIITGKQIRNEYFMINNQSRAGRFT